MFCHISSGMWAFVLNTVCTVESEFGDVSLLCFLGPGQSLTNCLSLQLLQVMWGFDSACLTYNQQCHMCLSYEQSTILHLFPQ